MQDQSELYESILDSEEQGLSLPTTNSETLQSSPRKRTIQSGDRTH